MATFIPLVASCEYGSQDAFILNQAYNDGSIRGFFGERVQQTVLKLIEHHMIHFIATDAHTPRKRSPKVQKALEAVTQLDSNLAKELFIENPLKVYQNELIEPRQPIEIVKKSFWKSLFSKRQK